MQVNKTLSRRDFLKVAGGVTGAALLSACAPAVPEEVTEEAVAAVPAEAEAVKLNMWTTPGGGQLEFYEPILKAFMEENPNITIEYGPIPPAESSEEVVLAAVATGTAPDLWAGMMRAFATQLVQEADVLVPLDGVPGFDGLVRGRQMDQLMPQVISPDGHNYFIPVFRNLEMYQWSVDMLESLGLEEPPRTYGEFLAQGPELKEQDAWLITSLDPDPTWWKRIADFLPLFYAATEGRLAFDGDHADFNNPEGLQVATFVQAIFENEYAPVEEMTDPFETGRSLCHEFGTWRLSYQMEHFPDFEFIVTPPVVPDDYPADKPIITWGDNKGWVVNKTGEHQAEAWKFLEFLFGNVEHDVQFFTIVGMLPCRQDLSTNPAFANLMAERPAAKAYADYFDKIVDWEPQPKLIELMDAFSTECWEPLLFVKKTPEQALADGEKAVNEVFAEG
jgi:multiple sugar transport system substrate-binding protein